MLKKAYFGCDSSSGDLKHIGRQRNWGEHVLLKAQKLPIGNQ